MTDELDFLNMTQDQFLDALLRPQRRPSIDTQRLYIELQATKENGILSLSKKIIDIECDNIADHFDSIPQELSEDFYCFADMVEKVIALPEECRQDKPEAAITRLRATPCFTKSRKGKPMIEPDGKGAYIWNDSFGPFGYFAKLYATACGWKEIYWDKMGAIFTNFDSNATKSAKRWLKDHLKDGEISWIKVPQEKGKGCVTAIQDAFGVKNKKPRQK